MQCIMMTRDDSTGAKLKANGRRLAGRTGAVAVERGGELEDREIDRDSERDEEEKEDWILCEHIPLAGSQFQLWQAREPADGNPIQSFVSRPTGRTGSGELGWIDTSIELGRPIIFIFIFIAALREFLRRRREKVCLKPQSVVCVCWLLSFALKACHWKRIA